MKRLLLFLGAFALSCPLIGQTPVYQNVIFVSLAPSGACTNGYPAQIVVSTGTMYTCQSGTWAALGGSGSGTVNTGTTGQIAGYSANGTVVGAIPATTFDTVGNLTNTKSITSNIIAAPVVAPLAVYGFGDSIMACAHVTNLPNCFINHLAAEADGSGTGKTRRDL